VRDKLRRVYRFRRSEAPGLKSKPIVTSTTPERASRIRQRQRLIDACISALHIHGPSRTTVEKVVALADLSPGIVRFYFESKDAMLIASLAYLAAEFEERVLLAVAQLKDTPVAALERLVALYLDPDIASPRKVSVWYSFWGEASSRQEYYDICGRKDEEFAALVRDLVARVVAMSGETHLDTDGIALGLIGALEVLWQGIAFQSEADIDREAARAQSMAFLRSVFPRQFGAERAGSPGPIEAVKADSPRHLPRSAYSDTLLLSAEREHLFRPAWQVIGHEAEVSGAGDFLTGDLASERALIVRDAKGVLRAFRNACRRRPHALVNTRTGHFPEAISCAPHGLDYGFDGRLLAGGTDGDLLPLEIRRKSGLILVRAAGTSREGGPALTGWDAFAALAPLHVQELEVAADWKLLVEQWLEGTSARGRFLAPNQLIEAWRGGAAILRVLPTAAGRSRLQRLDYGLAAQGRKRSPHGKRGADPRRLLDTWIAQQIDLAESTQTGLATVGDEVVGNGPVSAALAGFRGSIAALLPHLRAT
jgi:TetR/AcrR family transcriptional regulator, transcriptional repressor of bet genes